MKQIFNECSKCRVWLPVKEHKGNWYCSIHYDELLDEPVDKKRAGEAIKNHKLFRKAITVSIS